MDSDLKSTRESIMPKAKESFLEKRPDGPHQKEKFIKHIALKTPGDVLRLEDISKDPNEEADCSSAGLTPTNSGHQIRGSDQIRVASTKETKIPKPHLSLPQEKSAVKKASNLQKNKTASSVASQETKLLPLLSHVPSAGSSRVPLNAKNCTLPVPKKIKSVLHLKNVLGILQSPPNTRNTKQRLIRLILTYLQGKFLRDLYVQNMALLQSLPQLLWKLCHVFQAHQHLQIKPLQIKSVQEILMQVAVH